LTNDTIYGIIISGGEKMASIDKIVDKMNRQPNGIRIDEADKVLKHYGYDMVRSIKFFYACIKLIYGK